LVKIGGKRSSWIEVNPIENSLCVTCGLLGWDSSVLAKAVFHDGRKDRITWRHLKEIKMENHEENLSPSRTSKGIVSSGKGDHFKQKNRTGASHQRILKDFPTQPTAPKIGKLPGQGGATGETKKAE